MANKYRVVFLLPTKWPYDAIAIWPLILAKSRWKRQGLPAPLLRHELIHLAQQAELLLLPFYLQYLLEWFAGMLRYRNWQKAYSTISFEREAYAHQHDADYLKGRKRFASTKYLK